MALLVRIARQSELDEGQKLVKESHGRKILLARTRGQVFATDAHCFHMGGNLWEGDIEDIDGHACVVCPLHRYKIDMSTGQKVDRMLDGCVVCSDKQQQRTYPVYQDSDFICIHIPELHNQQALPSDRYNQVAVPPSALFQQQQPAAPPQAALGRTNFGLFGASTRQPQQQEGLAPYAGSYQRGHGLIPNTPDKNMLEDEPALQLSQEAPAAPAQQEAQLPRVQQAVLPQPHYGQGHIPFAQSRADSARIARRKAATAAIAARAYMPPSAPVQQQAPPAARGLFSTGVAAPSPARQGATGGLAWQPSGSAGQQSLLAFGFTVQPRSPAVTTGPEDMEM